MAAAKHCCGEPAPAAPDLISLHRIRSGVVWILGQVALLAGVGDEGTAEKLGEEGGATSWAEQHHPPPEVSTAAGIRGLARRCGPQAAKSGAGEVRWRSEVAAVASGSAGRSTHDCLDPGAAWWRASGPAAARKVVREGGRRG